MLTAKENLREVVRGGKPDRYVNQYEAFALLSSPYYMSQKPIKRGMENVVNAWGVTNSFPAHVPGAFPVHTPDKIVVKDIEHWQDYVHAPALKFTDEIWEKCKARYDAVDGTKAFKTAMVAPGIFEQIHHLCSMDEALVYYMTNPDEMHDLIKYLTDWELELAECICTNLHPDAMLHHDDWGSEKNSFLRPSMFEDYFLEPYKQIYGYYHDHGVEFIVHHSDSFAANLVPHMIEMGIDIWQGCMESNDVPSLIKQYGGKIAFMGNIDNKDVDFEGWTVDDCVKAARRAIESVEENKYYIPCITQGGPGSVFPGTYMALADAISDYNTEKFGFTREEQDAQRLPWQIMF